MWLLKPRPVAEFLHVGKTGGSAVKDALSHSRTRRRSKYRVHLHNNSTALSDIAEDARFFFCVRDPIDRFSSGFYSRQRKGRPKNDIEWTDGEAIAFRNFETPDELASALSSSDKDRYEAARYAMLSINHVRHFQLTWVGGIEGLENARDRLLLVMRQEKLEEDFAELTRRLEVDTRLPTDEVRAHRTPEHLERELSATALENLGSWYEEDVRFVEYCLELRRGMLERG
jgi:hypothetical protein